jgi:hypothetical protein
VGKLLKMRIQDYEIPPDPATLEPLFRYTVGDGNDTWSVEILRSTGDDPQYYAKGDYTRGVVHLTESLASETWADLEAVLPEPKTP